MAQEQQLRRPLPPMDPDIKPFFEAARRHEFLLQRCQSCGHYNWHPRQYCGECFSDNMEWVKGSGKGQIWSYSIVRQIGIPFFRAKLPYVVAFVQLDEGFKIMTNIVDCPPEQVRIGMSVTVTFEDVTDEYGVPLFKPAG